MSFSTFQGEHLAVLVRLVATRAPILIIFGSAQTVKEISGGG